MSSMPNNALWKRSWVKWTLISLASLLGSLIVLVAILKCMAPQLGFTTVMAVAFWDWKPFCLVLLLGTAAFALIFVRTDRKTKGILYLVLAIAILWVGIDLPDDCHIAGLAEEDDTVAAASCDYLMKHLGDARLEQLFDNREMDDNIRFYLAVIAATRGSELVRNPLLEKPGTMSGNRYLEAAEHIQFPIHYTDFAKAYRSQPAKP